MAKPALRCDVIVAGHVLPRHLSPSQFSKYVSCGLRYYFESVGGWREPANMASALGTIVHDTVEALYRLPADERSYAVATEVLVGAAQALLNRPEYRHLARDRTLQAGCVAALDRLFILESPPRVLVSPVDLECEVSAEIDGVSIRGRLDRRTRQPLRRITDYKTGRRPPAPVLAGKLTQLYIYAAAAEAAGDGADEIELLFLGGDGASVRRPIYPMVLARTIESLHKMRGASERDLAEAAFTATPSPLCAYCPFKRVCPAHRSNAPTPGSQASDNALRTAGLLNRDSTLNAAFGTAPGDTAASDNSARELDDVEPW